MRHCQPYWNRLEPRWNPRQHSWSLFLYIINFCQDIYLSSSVSFIYMYTIFLSLLKSKYFNCLERAPSYNTSTTYNRMARSIGTSADWKCSLEVHAQCSSVRNCQNKRAEKLQYSAYSWTKGQWFLFFNSVQNRLFAWLDEFQENSRREHTRTLFFSVTENIITLLKDKVVFLQVYILYKAAHIKTLVEIHGLHLFIILSEMPTLKHFSTFLCGGNVGFG